MVLMRRRDKRRGNEEDEIVVASDSTIVANKGVRSLRGARGGRFAADMRANVGGYGRPDKTWGVDHPWHSTQGNLYMDLCSRDNLEDGVMVREQEEEREAPAHSASRAALKKRKAKLKKQGLAPQEAAAAAEREAEEARFRREEQQRLAEQQAAEAKKSKGKKKAKIETADESNEGEVEKTEAADAEPTQAEKEASKKEKLKQKKKEKKKKQQQKQKLQRAEQDAAEKGDEQAQTKAEMATREALAKQYEAAAGSEVTAKSGLVIHDQRIGHGRLAGVGEMLTVRYRGRLGKDGMVFGKGMLTTRFGTGSVIAGWEEGLGTMRPGGVRHLTIPSELAYGASGKGGKIPPNATLFFEVELIRFGKRKRDTVGEDDVPLPSAFQRKNMQQKAAKKAGNEAGGDAAQAGKHKKKRRKHKRQAADE